MVCWCSVSVWLLVLVLMIGVVSVLNLAVCVVCSPRCLEKHPCAGVRVPLASVWKCWVSFDLGLGLLLVVWVTVLSWLYVLCSLCMWFVIVLGRRFRLDSVVVVLLSLVCR